MFSRINKILSKKDFVSFFLLSFFYFLLSILDFVGLGLLPIFLTIIIDENYVIEKIQNIEFIDISFVENYNIQLLFLTLIISVFIFKFLLTLLLAYYEANIYKGFRISIQSKVYKNFLFRDYSYFYDHNSSEIVRVILSDVERSIGYVRSFFSMFKDFLTCFVALVVLLLINFKLTVSTFSILISISVFFYFFYKPYFKKNGKISVIIREKMNRIAYETIFNIKNINVFSLQKNYEIDLESQNFSLSSQLRLIEFLQKTPKAFFETIVVILFLSLLFILENKIGINYDLFVQLSFISLAIIRVTPLLIAINQHLNALQNSTFSIDTVLDDLKKKYYSKSLRNVKDKIYKNVNINKITLNNLSFSYLKKKKSFSEKNILNKFNFEFKKNRVYGITGPSGAGKSTLVDIILGLIKPTKGHIAFNNDKNILNHQAYRKKLGYVPQDVFLKDDTLINNITCLDNNKEINQERLRNAIKMSGLDRFIEKKEHLQKQVGEKGIMISGGQKQRIGIARALYLNPQVILFDEPTSSLDEDIEKRILDQIFDLKNKTIIIISHKLYTLKKCNEIILLKNGTLKKTGNIKKIGNYLKSNFETLNSLE